jgi:beta-lactamase superfamily II metal-dependent hydrolase
MRILIHSLFFLLFPFIAYAAPVEVRVVDVGAGLCCIIKMPGNKYIVYDAGLGNKAADAIKETVGTDSIEMLILSHTDADHWGAVEHIVTSYKVKKVLKTDYRYGEHSQVYKKSLKAIEKSGAGLVDLASLKPGSVLYSSDDAELHFVAGFTKPPADWGTMDEAMMNNSVSIVVRLEYEGRSVLICGDAVGKESSYQSKQCKEENECIATEKYMLDHSQNLLDSDVLIAPHHGADNASCSEFITRVSPEYVVFSCGDKHRHPLDITMQRYIASGVKKENIYRTDTFDKDENKGVQLKPCQTEYTHERKAGHRDDVPDDVIIKLEEAKVEVGYVY